jgi:tetratricopeptide (TPR) repeat protein
LAERYEGGGRSSANAAQLAHHWRQADNLPRAMGYLALAGDQALRAGAYREAGGFLREALQIAEGLSAEEGAPGPAERARWERQLGEAYHGIGLLNESRELLGRAAARLGYPAPDRLRAEIPGLGRELLRQAARALGGAADGPPADSETLSEAARTYAMLARLAYYDSQLPAAIFAAVRSLNLAEQAGGSAELAGAYATAHLAAAALPPLAAFYRRRAQETARLLGHLPTQAWVAEAQGLASVGRGDWRRAGGALNFALAIADSLGDQRRRAECRAMLALRDLYRGDFAAALGRCAELYAAGQLSGDVQVRTWGLIGQAESLLNMGDAARAAALLDDAAGLLAENLGSTRAEEIWAYALRARAALRGGEHELALALAGAAAGLVGRLPPAAIYALGGYSAIAEVFLELWSLGGAPGVAARAGARRACAILGRFALIFPVARPAAQIWRGRYAWARGRRAEARWRWGRALSLARRLGMPYEQGRALLLLGRVDEAAAIFGRIGAAHELARAVATPS